MEHKPLRIPTDERLTSWLFTQCNQGAKHGNNICGSINN